MEGNEIARLLIGHICAVSLYLMFNVKGSPADRQKLSENVLKMTFIDSMILKAFFCLLHNGYCLNCETVNKMKKKIENLTSEFLIQQFIIINKIVTIYFNPAENF